jgi:hypothetical protein
MVVTRTTTFVDGNTLTASQLNGEFNNLLNAPAIVNADIASGAGIVFSKLDSVTVAGVTATQTLTNKTLTNPNVTSLYRARAYLGADITGFANNAHTKVALDTIDYDPNSNFNAGGNRWTCPITGIYLIKASVGSKDGEGVSGTRFVSEVYKNGSTRLAISVVYLGGVNGVVPTCGAIVSLTATDYIELFAFQDSGATKTIFSGGGNSAYTWLAIHLLSQ